MARKHKSVTRQSSIEGAIDDAKSEIESLRDEMSEWKDNLDNANMSHMSKYDEVSEAYDALDGVVDKLESLDLSELGTAGDATITYTEAQPYGRKPQPRWMRLANATAALSAAKDALEQARDEDDTPECTCENPPEDAQSHSDEHELDCPLYVEDNDDAPGELDFDTPINELDEALNEAEAISFPGMY